MRKINGLQIVTFIALFACALALAIIAISILDHFLSLGKWLGDFRGVLLSIAGVVALYVFALTVFRVFLHFLPLLQGEILPDSRQEFIYHVYLLFFLILFYPVMRSGMMPVPLMRLFYMALGARLGANTYSSGILLDPQFVELGDNTLVGQYALLVPHVIEGAKLAHYPIRVGNEATVGAGAIVLSGVTIGNRAIVSTGAVVTKGTNIPDGEIWGGVPAKPIGKRAVERSGDAIIAGGLES